VLRGESPASTGSFSRDLETGATGSDVKALQQYLNNHGFDVASSGAGSAGNETERFGGLTRAALIKLQKSAGITPAVGYFGPKTRAYIAAHP
jgi:peptidoglycan hydrolase-like protein with peptidoglycan-binding domain